MGDVPDSEIVKSVVNATVVKKTGDLNFTITEDNFETSLEVDAKFKDKITQTECRAQPQTCGIELKFSKF